MRPRVLTRNVRSLARGDAYGRLAATPMSLAKPHDLVWAMEERLTHQELANMVGASRKMVTRLFRNLSAGGYITVEKRRITIQRKLPRHCCRWFAIGARVWVADHRLAGNGSRPP